MQRIIYSIVRLMNYLAAASVMAMTLLTSADVVLRLFKHPILGTYELVGLLGALTIAFAIPATTLANGHVAVEFVVDKLPRRFQNLVTGGTHLVSIALFGLITWQSYIYARDLQSTGEVTLSLQLPFYPVVYAIAAACLLVCCILLLKLFHADRQGVVS
ncbi:MAG: TRAP transporter small permease [Deltaproteobacteria bacterium]|nr:TRAP transporter small permease [Candidatus Anaeroferrophillus wilburensis]MBN2887883.1 TRAP transporter small permease [Deltaproteobacteria bacterium]